MDVQFRIQNPISFEYDMFMLETMIEDYKLEIYVNESILLASTDSNINEFKIVHENFKEKISNAFSVLLDTISKLWGKFIETTASLLKTDQGYLDKYRDLILSGNFKGMEFQMYPYWDGLKYLTDSKVPAFNYSSLKDSLVSEEKFINTHFKTFVKEGVNFSDRVKQLMRGSDKEQRVDASVIKPDGIFNYCKDFPNIIKKIENDMKEIERAGNDAISNISKLPTTNTNENFSYSFVKESILVTEIKRIDNMNSKDVDRPNISKMIKNVDGEHNVDPDSIKNDVDNIADDLDRIKLYIRVCYNFLGAKMSIAQEMYKAFMYIIREYVKSKVGVRDKKSSTNEPKSEDKKSSTNEPIKKSSDDSSNKLQGLKNFVSDKIKGVGNQRVRKK